VGEDRPENMLIVDAQLHIWGANTPERPWPAGGKAPHRAVPFSKDDALREMNAAGVDRAVLVPAVVEGKRNDLALEAARLHPDRFAIMGLLDVASPGARVQIAGWRKQPGMLGLRLTSEQIIEDWLWAEAEAAGIPIMRSASKPHLLEETKHVAERYPGLKLVIDHLGIPKGTKDEKAFAHLDELIALSRLPNIAVKASCLPHYTTDSYPYRRLHPYIRRVYDAFGPKRMFWGSDLVRLPCTYRQLITMFTEEMSWLTTEDKEWIMGRGLCDWVGWT
jgi:L-fuconolactonase